MTTKIQWIFFYVFVFVNFAVGQQDNNLIVNGLLDHSNGLPPGSTNKILRSFKGHLWVATQAGLFIYDGKSYKKVKIIEKKEIIPTFLAEDTQGNLWIGSNNGLFKIKHATQEVEERLSDEITGFAMGGGNIWVSTHANHLYHLSLRDNQLQLVQTFTQSENKKSSTVHDLNLDDFGHLWFIFDGNVYQYFINEKKIKIYNQQECGKIYIHEGKLVVTFSKNDIQVIENNKSRKIYNQSIGEWFFPFRYSETEIAILLAPNQLKILNTQDFSIKYVGKLNVPEQVVFIKDVAQYDHLTYFSSNAGLLSLSKINQNFNYLLSGKSMRSIYQDSKKQFWFASYSGLFVSDHQLKNLQKIDFKDIAYCFLEVDNQIFIGTEGNGLFQYKNKELKKINHNLFNRSKEILCLEWIPEDSKIWAGTYQGILSMDPQMESIKYIANTKYPAFAQADVQVIKRTQKNIVWVGTKNGLYRVRKQHSEWVWDQPIPDLASVGISDIRWIGQHLWIGTMRNGLYKVNSDLSFIKIGFEAGLSSDNIVRIEAGNGTDLWVSTEFGLNHVDGENIESFFAYDGIINNEFNFSSSFQNDNYLFFGGIHGITYFLKSKPPAIQNQNHVFISNLSFRDAKTNKIKTITDYQNQVIHISSESRTLSINLGSSDFTFPWLARFKYKLDQDTIWSYNETNRLLFFSSLLPGNHKLVISSCGANGKWSNKTITINFVVEKAPFFRTADYQILAFSFLIIFLGYKYLEKKFKIKKREVETNIGKIIQNEMIPPINRKVILTDKIKSRFPEVENVCEMLHETNVDSKFLIEELSESLINPHEDLLSWYKNWKVRIEHLLIFNEVEWQDHLTIDQSIKLTSIEDFYLSIVCKELLQIFIHNKVKKMQFSIFPHETSWKLIFYAPDSRINLTEQQTFWLIEQLDRQISSLPLDYKMLFEDGFGIEIVKISSKV